MLNVKRTHLTRAQNMLCGEGNQEDPRLFYCSQSDGLWIARHFNSAVIAVRVRCGTNMNLQGEWAVGEFVKAIQTGK